MLTYLHVHVRKAKAFINLNMNVDVHYANHALTKHRSLRPHEAQSLRPIRYVQSVVHMHAPIDTNAQLEVP